MDNTQSYQWLLFTTKLLTLEELEIWCVNHKLQLDKAHCLVEAISLLEAGELCHFNQLIRINIRVQHLAVESSDASVQSVDLSVEWRKLLDSLATEFQCDYCVLPEDFTLRAIQLAVFDMDSTLIPVEVIDELGKEAGVQHQVADITESAMRGELDFNQSFEQRLQLLKGMPDSAVTAVRERLQFNPGVETFLQALNKQDVDIAIASGGFIPFAEQLAKIIKFSAICANQLEFEQGKLTGVIKGPIVNAEMKAEMLGRWRQERGLSISQTMAVGDGANDYLMLNSAGFGVAYKAKPFLKYRADCVLQFSKMDALEDIVSTVINYS